MSNPFIMPEDDTGFGKLPLGPSPSEPPLSAPPPRDPHASATHSRAGSGITSTPAEDAAAEALFADDRAPLVRDAGGVAVAVAVASSGGGGGGGATSSSSAPLASSSSSGDVGRAKKTGWIFSAAYYQQWFDVDTDDVLSRTFEATAKCYAGSFARACDGNPDLYGPFWICATLVFLHAMGGNYAQYMSSKGKSDGEEWSFDIEKISVSSAMFFGYCSVAPVLLYLVLRCFAGVPTSSLSFVQLVSTYGYALTVYVPVSLLCVVPSEAFRWMSFIAGMAVSASFLFTNVRPIAGASPKGAAVVGPVVTAVVGAHVLFGILLKLFFFQSF